MLGVLLAQSGPLARLMVAVGRLSVAIPCTSPTTPPISSIGNGCSCVKKYMMASVSANQLHVADSGTYGLGPGRGGPPRSCPGPLGPAPIPTTPLCAAGRHIRLPRVGPVPAGTILGFLGVSYRSFLQAFLPPTPKTRLARRCPRSPNFVVLPSVPKFTDNPPRLASDADHCPVHPPSPRRLPVLRGTMLLHRRRRESLRR